MIRVVVDYLINNNFHNLKADLPEYGNPEKISWKSTGTGHVPDISAEKDNENYIFEVETSDTITIGHTEDQWKLFAVFAKEHHCQFTIVIPKGYKDIAEEQLNILDVVANVLEVG